MSESGVPSTTLRAAQFHDLVLTVVRGLARLPVILSLAECGSSRSTRATWRPGSWS